MKDWPSVRGSSKTSRANCGAALRLLVSSRGVVADHRPETRSPSGHHIPPPSGPSALQNLKFESCLPVNLRTFLKGELGARLNIDDSTIGPASGEQPDAFIRDLARAIRRFSFARAHEAWVEVSFDRERLEQALTRARIGAAHVMLCLRCAQLSVGGQGEHRDSACLTLSLHGFTSCDYEREPSFTADVRRNLYRDILNFRRTRQAQGLPHFDLDYYLRDQHYVFTWHPLKSA